MDINNLIDIEREKELLAADAEKIMHHASATSQNHKVCLDNLTNCFHEHSKKVSDLIYNNLTILKIKPNEMSRIIRERSEVFFSDYVGYCQRSEVGYLYLEYFPGNEFNCYLDKFKNRLKNQLDNEIEKYTYISEQSKKQNFYNKAILWVSIGSLLAGVAAVIVPLFLG